MVARRHASLTGQSFPHEGEIAKQLYNSLRTACDLEAVALITYLPMEGRGELEDEPVLRLTAATFLPAFRQLVAMVNDLGSGSTFLDRICDAPRPPSGRLQYFV